MKNMLFLYFREINGLSQQEVAEEVGICKDYVNKYNPFKMLQEADSKLHSYLLVL